MAFLLGFANLHFGRRVFCSFYHAGIIKLRMDARRQRSADSAGNTSDLPASEEADIQRHYRADKQHGRVARSQNALRPVFDQSRPRCRNLGPDGVYSAVDTGK
jgi:hypothetical protein